MPIDTVFVRNTNDFAHQDRFNGEDYFFPVQERVPVPLAAAQHMFGWGNPDKEETLVRLGWAWIYSPEKRNFVPDPDGVKKLARFVVTQAVMVEAEVASPKELASTVTLRTDGKLISADGDLEIV